MADKQLKEGRSMKQKLTIGAVIVVILVILWQVKGMLGIGAGSSSPPTEPVPVMKSEAPAPSRMSEIPSPGGIPPRMAHESTGTAPPRPEINQVSLMTPEMLKEQQMAQSKYLSKLNELEDLKLQQSIAETNQAIATAKLATVTAEQSIAELLTKPKTGPGSVTPMGPGTLGSELLGPARAAEGTIIVEEPKTTVPSTTTTTVVTTPPPPEPEVEVPYTVISVSMQLYKWTAVVGYQGKMFNVMVGDLLPPDNSRVVGINKNGVVLRKNSKTRTISVITSAI